jgi:predicted Zn finger-like uncharacterized protein
MAIETACPACEAGYRLQDTYADKLVRCRGCRETFPVPADGASEGPAATPLRRLNPLAVVGIRAGGLLALVLVFLGLPLLLGSLGAKRPAPGRPGAPAVHQSTDRPAGGARPGRR